MKKNPAIKFCFVLSLLFLITHYSLLITVLHAVTVDLYQDCESGSSGDTLTASIMNASNYGQGVWSATLGAMYVSGNRVRRLPGTVTVRGGSTYTDSGTRTWAVRSKYANNYIQVNINGSHPNVTIACYFTPGPTGFVYNYFDTMTIENTYPGVMSLHKNGSGPLHMELEACDVNWTNWHTSSTDIPLVPEKTYWICLNLNGVAGTNSLVAYDPDTWTQVGSICTTWAAVEPCSNCLYIKFGRSDNHGDNLSDESQSNFDNIMVDYTNGAFPLLPDIGPPDTTPPGNITTVNDGTGTDIDSTASTTQLSANWTAAMDAQSGIAKYYYAIGTTAGGSNTANWTDNGSATAVTKTGLTLAIGTTYYVSVKAQNGAGMQSSTTTSDGQYVSSDVTPPSAPATVRDGTGSADSSSTTSKTQLSANWTASSDAESGISGYQYAIGTTAGGTNIANWLALGNVMTVTKTGLSLAVGTTYYFSVKAVNGAGLTGASTNSNGQVVLSTAVADTTAPNAPGTVRDGPTAGMDAVFTYSTTTLSANWTAATDMESGISAYQYAIGTTAGGTNITNWIGLGNVLTVTKTGLSLTLGTTYYFSVKAVNWAGLSGPTGNSNGQYVKVIIPGDTTPPGNITEVRDGTGAGDDVYTCITTELSANWDNSADSESGISRYYFAIGSSPGATNITGWADNGELTSVTQTGLSLVIGTTYYFSVKAENGVALQSTPANSDGVCIISGALPPVISNVQSINITANSATISWTTDKQATSQVEYGITAVYGSQTTEDSSLVTAHRVVITGLTAGQVYHYRVISKDVNSNQAVSVDFTFTTLSPPAEVTDIRAYPNPCDFSNGKVIKFVVGAAGSETGEVRIYTMSGKLIRKISGTNEISWDGDNENGERVVRGVYLYQITDGNGDKTTGKIAIMR